MDNQRLILVIALSLIVLLLWQAWEKERRGPQPQVSAPAVQREVPSAPPATPAPGAAPAPSAEPTLASAGQVRVTTDLMDARIDLLGGDLRELYLLQYPISVDKPAEPFSLLRAEGPEMFVIQSGLIGTDGAYPNHKTRFTVSRTEYTLPSGQDRLDVVLNWAEGALRAKKTYTFHRNSYLVDVRYDVENGSSSARNVYQYAQLLRMHTPQTGYLNVAPSYTGGAIYTPDNRYEKIAFDRMKEKPLARETNDGWVALLQHYFVGAGIPANGNHQFYTDTQSGPRYILGYKSVTPQVIAPGQSVSIDGGRYYLGPKEQHRLEKAAPGLVLSVDYGWLTVIAAPLYWILERIHELVKNWGWSIILLTVLIKLVFYPLSAASYKSMGRMRRLQPRLEALRKSYGDDRTRMNQAMMELYRTEKINPLGGCLPILIQIPVFIALYWVLLESVELRQAPFALWIRDLSTPDPYFVLPIIMGVTMVLQQMMNPTPLEPLQKKIMMALPVLFTVFFLFFASGLVLYWLVNNVLSIAQQWWITRSLEAKPA